MNITLSTDAEIVHRTREYAREHGTSLNQLVREYLRTLTARDEREQVAREFIENATTHAGRSPMGFVFEREAAQRAGS